MSIGLAYLLASLAAYRLTRFVVIDTLTQGSREKLRAWAFDDEGHPRSFSRGKLGYLATCVFCTGFWASGLAWAGVLVGTGRDLEVGEVLVGWWAVAGLQVLLSQLEKVVDGVGDRAQGLPPGGA
jgi:hypothetical protein